MFCKNLCDKVSKIKNWRCTFYSFFHALRRGVLCFFCRCIFHGENCKTKSPVLTFLKKAEKGDFVSQFSPWKMHQQKKQSTPRQRTWKNKEDGSLHFFRRPPESGLILHRSCVIYDGSRPPETGHVTKSWLLIGQPSEMAPSQHSVMVPQPCGKVPPPLPHFESKFDP